MIPRTFPSTYASNGQQQMVVYFLTSIAGLQRWADYIPVKLSQGGVENSYANNGYIDVTVISSPTATQQAWKEYIPVYLDDSATDAWLVNAVGYIPYGYALFSDASLMLDMTNGGRLDPRITFSRTTNATLTDSTGTLVYAPHNLLVQSESFDSSSWSKTRATITANTTVAPDGTTTADKLVEQTDVATNRSAGQTVAVISGFQYTFSVYVQAAERTQINLRFSSGFAAGNTFFTLTGSGSATNAGIVDSSSITNVGGGWYRCTFTQTATSSVSAAAQVFLASSGAITYDGVAGNGLFIWGAQLNVSTLQPYNPTTVRNLLGFTQEYDASAWVKTASTITANTVAAPDGSVTADTITANATTGRHDLLQITASLVISTLYSASIFAKKGTHDFIQIAVENQGADFANFNLATGTVETTGGPITTAIQNAGNGWYRCVMIYAATGTVRHPVFSLIPANTSSRRESWTALGTETVFIWGAQLSDSASLDPYVYNPAAAPTSTAYYGPRFDYDPVTLAARGLLIEEQRTNSIRNNTMVGAVAGTPGTLPTNWSATSSANGITREVLGTGQESGIIYIDLKYNGTATATTNFDINFEGSTSVSALNGQTWTASSYIKLSGGSNANATVTLQLTGRDSGGVFVSGQAASKTVALTTSDLAGTRESLSLAMSSASVASVLPFVRVSVTSGAAIDITLRIGLPQLELGAFSTSVIPTTTAAATRAADVASMVGDNFGNWYRADEGTLFAEGSSVNSISGTTSRRYAELHDGSTSNLINVEFRNTNQSRFSVVDAGVSQASINGSGTINQTSKIAGAYKVDDFAFSANGILGTPDTSGTVPVVNRMTIGSRSDNAGAATINGHIRRIAFINRRVSDAELQALTA